MGVYICINLCDVSLVFGWLKEVDMGIECLIPFRMLFCILLNNKLSGADNIFLAFKL